MVDFLECEAGPFQADDIQSLGRDVEIGVQEVRRDIAVHASVAADHRKAADFRILVDDDASRNESLVFDLDVPGDQSATGDHGIVSDDAVMRNVAGSHDVVPVADACH